MDNLITVALTPGQVGFYDDLSGIYLSLKTTQATVAKGVNMTGIINGIKAGKIMITSGSLETESTIIQEAVNCMPTYYRLLEKKRVNALKTQKHRAMVSKEIRQAVEEVVEAQVENTLEIKLEDTLSNTTENIVENITDVVVEEEIEITPKKKTTKRKKEAVVEVEETKEG